MIQPEKGELGKGEHRSLSSPVEYAGDVAKLKNAEELRRSERRFRALTQNASDIITLLGADGTIHYQSPSIERVLGYRPEEQIEENIFDYVHPEDLGRVQRAFTKGLADSDLRPSAEYRFRHKDGSWCYLESVGSNLLDDPEVGEFVVNSRDITERKRTEEALRKSEWRMAEAERLAHVGSWEWDVRSNILSWSDELYRIFGLSKDVDLSYEGFIGGIHPADREFVRGVIQDVCENHAPRAFSHRIVWPNGAVRWLRCEAVATVDEAGSLERLHGMAQDITELRQVEERLKHQAFHDSLTSLPNRQLFVDRLNQALGRTRRRPRRKVAVLFMDLDNFKGVNDSLGHELGDRLLVAVGERIRECLRPEDTLARFGGDEFTVLVDDVGNPADAVRVARRIIEAHREPFVLEGRELFIKPSIGIALGITRTSSTDELLREADTAMFRAKEEGLGYRVFEPVMYEQALRRLKMENELQHAIENEEFVIHYQPIIDLRSEEVWGMEALVRWRHPERGVLDPEEFVPAAEQSGLVVPMGEQVLEKACKQAKEWQERHPHMLPPLVMSVNLSAWQVERSDLDRAVEKVLDKTGFEASCLNLDITETIYIKVLEGNTAAPEKLKKMGVRISIDDFGTVYSSLSYLKQLPADILKIDKSFVAGLGKEVENTAIVRMIIDLAHTFGMEVVAEGVESEVQAEQLRQMGCERGQGYYFAKALAPEAASEFLAR
jgi:diguanylate cyclase (GGDEF)-like protein/PAS domain S-box-containing protein